eukprot:7383921-Prymnesium_polylepis.1
MQREKTAAGLVPRASFEHLHEVACLRRVGEHRFDDLLGLAHPAFQPIEDGRLLRLDDNRLGRGG